MSLLENLALALDSEGVPARVREEVLIAPLGNDVDIRLRVIDANFPAINIYIGEEVLVSVAFSLEDAVNFVLEHLATADLVNMMRELLTNSDGRLTDMEFYQDDEDMDSVCADVGTCSTLHIRFFVEDNIACAAVQLITEDEEYVEMGTFSDFDRLANVLAFASDHAEGWEAELAPVIDY
ncbi:MAG: hypothetical protein Q3972_02025 [Corynebacterium sp.]|nr:hypothetical protein [Corynebacterium sp.]